MAVAQGGLRWRRSRPIGYWVDDEGLLRDEGALFGFAAYQYGENPEMLRDKLACITKRYAPLIDEAAAAHKALHEEHLRRTTDAEEARAQAARYREIAAPPGASEFDALEPAAAYQRLRFGAAGGAAFAGAALSGWLVYDHLSKSGLEHPLVVSAAVCLLGYAAPFQPLAMLHSRQDVIRDRRDHAEPWKLHLGEWLLPLCAAGFVGVYTTVGLSRAIVVTLLLATAFVFIGKLMASTLTRFAVARRRGREEADRIAARAEEVVRATKRAEEHEAEVRAHEQALLRIHDRMDELEKEIAHYQGEVAYKSNLFLSEYRFGLATMHRRAASGDGASAAPPPFDLGDPEVSPSR